MKCPVDGSELKMAERQGVEIDYCPQCRGVWLDRGELDKIIEKATPAVELDDPDPYLGAPAAAVPPRAPRREERAEERYDGRREERYYDERGEKYGSEKYGKDSYRKRDKYDDRDKYYRKKKRKSFLKELFDVFD